VADFDRRLVAGATTLRGWHLHGLDLRAHDAVLGRLDVFGAVFVGCDLGDPTGLEARGAVVLPRFTGVPVETGRTGLYTARELYDTPRYTDSLDARVYAWSQRPEDRETSLTRALHDHAVDDALAAWVHERRLVGVMGGHALVRGSEGYAAAARLGRALGSTHVVATGGGPGR